MATKDRVLSYLEIAYLIAVNSRSVIRKKKFKFLLATAYCQLKVSKNIHGQAKQTALSLTQFFKLSCLSKK